MITAKEARKLVDESGKLVHDYIKYNIEQKVVDAAKAGKGFIHVSIDTLGPFEHLDQKMKPIEKGVIAELIKLGYRAELATYGEPYIPRGLANDDCTGPMHRNYGFYISW